MLWVRYLLGIPKKILDIYVYIHTKNALGFAVGPSRRAWISHYPNMNLVVQQMWRYNDPNSVSHWKNKNKIMKDWSHESLGQLSLFNSSEVSNLFLTGKRFLWWEVVIIRQCTYLLLDWARRCDSTSVIRARAGISFRHLLAILPPVATIVHLFMEACRQ
jgi:hypothetical protein